ncbi:putative T6SS immunity periplasmic lipoprotein [Pseudescherichia sp.]|uniref:putative T6SS immunity periplasmic lipoprotein n=1 Tax=Pseudescherichia sp. TaxID=2055881 RepID=UPI0028968B9A|nr:putative T6SS immunity periplasmic lipoprotein [Pseudescherichia sp.]
MKSTNKISPLLLVASISLLAGCPGSGDRLKADETAAVSKCGENICFQVPDAGSYQPTLIAINPRGTPPQKLKFTDSPMLAVENGNLCLSPDFYHFPENGQYIVQYILEAPGDRDPQRSVVTGIEFSDGHVRSIPLNEGETTGQRK